MDAVQAEALQRHQGANRVVLCPGGDAAVIPLEILMYSKVTQKHLIDSQSAIP